MVKNRKKIKAIKKLKIKMIWNLLFPNLTYQTPDKRCFNKWKKELKNTNIFQEIIKECNNNNN